MWTWLIRSPSWWELYRQRSVSMEKANHTLSGESNALASLWPLCSLLSLPGCLWPGFISWLLPSSGLQFDSSLALLPSFSAVLSILVYRSHTKGHIMEATVQDSVCHTVCLIQGKLATFCTFSKYLAGEKKKENRSQNIVKSKGNSKLPWIFLPTQSM